MRGAQRRRARAPAGALSFAQKEGPTEGRGARPPVRASIGDYIEGFYNTTRRHSYLGYKSPFEFELKVQVAALAA